MLCASLAWNRGGSLSHWRKQAWRWAQPRVTSSLGTRQGCSSSSSARPGWQSRVLGLCVPITVCMSWQKGEMNVCRQFPSENSWGRIHCVPLPHMLNSSLLQAPSLGVIGGDVSDSGLSINKWGPWSVIPAQMQQVTASAGISSNKTVLQIPLLCACSPRKAFLLLLLKTNKSFFKSTRFWNSLCYKHVCENM